MGQIFPKQFKDYIYVRATECFGIALFLFLLFSVISVFMYQPTAPSFFSASNFPTRNFYGMGLADILLECFGISVLLSLLAGMYAAVYFIRYKIFLKRMMMLAFVTSIVLQMFANCCGIFACQGIIPYLFLKVIPTPKLLFFLGLCIVGMLYFVPFKAILKMLFKPRIKVEKQIVEPIIKEPTQIITKPNVTKKIEIAQDFLLPSLDLLDVAKDKSKKLLDSSYFERAAERLEQVLREYGVKGKMEKIHPGPVVTLYEFNPAPDIKTSRIISLCDDIARSMSALSARISVIPGQSVIGIELPNEKRKTVYLRELLETDVYMEDKGKLMLALGQNISGYPFVVDLAKMPHLLVAGTTGSGKSVAINTMILSLLYRLTPSQCRFVMIDPKMLELSVYDGIPHLLAPVVTDPKKAINALKWAVREMETRYNKMSKVGVRNIDSYNARMIESRERGQVLMKRVQIGFDQESGKPIFDNETLSYETLHHIVVVVDEMADLMMVAGKEIEICVQRLAQMARAAGIHLIMATQRPSVDVITGTIKANFPTRISFHVTSKIDSRTILGEQGAEQLLGQGDMLYMASGGKITRVHGPFVNDQEVERIVHHLKQQGTPQFSINLDVEEDMNQGFGEEGDDPIFTQAVDLIIREGRVSTSRIQRQFKIGYNRAARIVDEMEEKGIISSADHTGKRQILAS